MLNGETKAMMLEALTDEQKVATTSQYDHFLHEAAVIDGQGWSVMGFIAPDAQ